MNIVKYLLIFLVVILSFVSETHAQPAWVLWTGRNITRYDPISIDITWELEAAFPNYDQCIRASVALAKFHEKELIEGGFAEEVKLIADTIVIVKVKKKFLEEFKRDVKNFRGYSEMIMQFRCFPDSIDPRK